MKKRMEDGITLKTIELKTRISFNGNWNHKNGGRGVYTKPIGIMILEGIEFVMCHDEIKELIKLYHDVDVYSMGMILDEGKDTGEVKRCEQSFLDKISEYILDLKKDERGEK